MSSTPSNIDTVPNNAPSPDELPQTSVLVVFIGLLVAMTVGALDQTIVATALPTIVGEMAA